MVWATASPQPSIPIGLTTTNNELQGYDGVTFQYDANGNTIEKNDNGNITKYFYNIEDRLVRVEDGAGTVIATYYYDPFGRRLWKEVDEIRTYFVYSDEGLVGEYDASGHANPIIWLQARLNMDNRSAIFQRKRYSTTSTKTTIWVLRKR